MEGSRGRLFYLFHPAAASPPRGAVLYAHPFAEELNRSRRMAALQARLLAENGYAVLLPDLYGCGDSGGDFADATWEGWLEDLDTARRWLQARVRAPLLLWGTRCGCLLLDALAHRDKLQPEASLYWQPVVSGEQHLAQFLRLRVAAGMMAGGGENSRQLRERLAHGEALEVAGYTLAPTLAAGLAGARLQAPPGGALRWLEVSQEAEPSLSPIGARTVVGWRGPVVAAAVAGPPFWATQEISEVPALLTATLDALQAVRV